MHTLLISWARLAFLAGLALCLVLVIPVAWMPFQLIKLAAFAVALTACAVLYVAGGGVRDLLRAHGLWLALGVLALPLAYALSWALSVDRSVGLLGSAVETDTLIFVGLAAGAYVLSFALFRTLRTVRMLLSVVFWALVVATVFQLVSILFGQAVLPFDSFADRSTNLVGKWNDLGFLSGLLALLLFARVELRTADHLWRVAATVGGALLVFLLALVNFVPAWVFFLVGCAVLALLALLDKRAGVARGLPWLSFAGIVAAALFLIFGSTINTSLTSVFPVSSLEVRPSLASTWQLADVERSSKFSRAFVGTGPGTFGERWLLEKPAEVNSTPFWNLDFNVGYSTVATALITTGLLGVLAWLVPLLLMLLAVVRAARVELAREEKLAATTLLVAAFFVYATLLFYVPSQNLVLLAFVLSGAALGFLWRQGRSAAEEKMAPRYAVLALSALFVVAMLLTGGFVARRFVAQAYTGAGFYALAQGDAASAVAYADRAVGIEPAPDALRLRTVSGIRVMSALAQDTSRTPEEVQTLFGVEAERTVAAGQALIAAAPGDYRSHFVLGQVYQLFTSLNVTGAYQAALAAYETAAARSPMSPAIPLEVARLEAAQGDVEATKEAITKALTLKPDYTDAIVFLVQLNVAQNDLPAAIQNAEAAARSAPGVASIWFELGVLYQAAGETEKAGAALERALELEPDYANAKYYLGLIYDASGFSQEALALFEDLARTNGNNEVVQKIVENLRAGKPALEGVSTEEGEAPVEE